MMFSSCHSIPNPEFMPFRADAVEPLDPPAGAKVGDRVTCDGQSDGAPDAQLKSKQKVWETLQVRLVDNV
jgi:hypothetical protein